MTHEILARAAKIKLLLMDVDGVLTDGRLYNVPGPDGKMFETKGFDSQDGIALRWLTWHGIQTGVISGRVSPATAERARQVAMTYVYQGHEEKIPIVEEILAKSNISRPSMSPTPATISPTSSSCAASASPSPSPMPARK